MKKLFLVFIVIALVSLAVAEGTRQWKETGYDEFEKGTARGIAIRSTGQIELAPAFKAIYTSPSSFIWSIAADKDGVVYAATGAPARVYRVTPDGKSTVIFEPKELQVQSSRWGRMARFMRPHRPMARYIESRANRAARRPPRSSPQKLSLIQKPSTSGTWSSMRKAVCTSPPETMARFFAWRRTARARSSSSPMKRTCACSRLIRRAT